MLDISNGEFQRHISALMITDDDFLRRFEPLLKHTQYLGDNPTLRWIAVESLEHYRMYRHAPGPSGMRMRMADTKLQPGVIATSVELTCVSIEELGVPTQAVREYVCDRLERYIRKQAILSAITETRNLVDTDPDRAVAVVEEAARIRLQTEKFLVLPDELDRVFDFFDPLRLTQSVSRTGVVPLDRALEGGLRKGELGVFMAGTGVGKSQLLVQCGGEAIADNYTVVHFSLENSEEQTAGRYISYIARKAMKDAVGTGSYENRLALRKLLSLKTNSLSRDTKIHIKWIPPTNTDVRVIESHLERLELDGVQIGLVIVDYGDLMRSTARFEKKYDDQAQVFSELRDLAMRHDVPLWTATQANRKALNTQLVHLDHIGESLGKAQKADMIISMAQTEEEGKIYPAPCRLQVQKMRRSQSYGAIECETFFDISHILPRDDSRS